MTISPASNIVATVGTPLAIAFSATGGIAPYTFTLAPLPTGLILAGNLLSGTPTTSGQFNFVVTATDSGGTAQVKNYRMTVGEVIPATSLAPTTPPTMPPAAKEWQCSKGHNNPEDAQFCSRCGKDKTANQPWMCTICNWENFPEAIECWRCKRAKPIPWTCRLGHQNLAASRFCIKCGESQREEDLVQPPKPQVPAPRQPAAEPPEIVTMDLLDGQVGQEYSILLEGKGGAEPYSWSAGGLPEGLSISRHNDTLEGKPARAGTYRVGIVLTDADGQRYRRSLDLTIKPQPKPFWKKTVLEMFRGGN